MDWATVIAFVIYLLVVLGIALVAWHLTRNLSDFVLGGRRLGGAVAALSAGASDMSAWLLLGLPGLAFAEGLSAIWLPIGLTIGAYINWRVVAKPLRIYTEMANDSLTIPAFLSHRFKEHERAIRVVAAASILLFFAFYTASGLVAGALLMEKMFGLNYSLALFSGTAIIIAYTFVGGFLAVSWTDFVQGSLMFLCLLAVPVVAMHTLGGWDATSAKIHILSIHGLEVWRGLEWLTFINLMAWGLGYFGQPHILVRFMAVKSYKEIPLARRICMGWMSLSMAGAVGCGLVGIAFFNGVLPDAETVFIHLSSELLSPWLAGLVMAAILSSTMCAIDSQMLASSSALTEDLYHVIVRPQASNKELMWVGRAGVMLISIVAISLALKPDSTVLNLVGFAWAGLAATFAVPVVMSLFWRQTTSMGVVWGMALGAITVVICKFMLTLPVYEILPGILMSFVGVRLGSRLSKPPLPEVLAQYDHVKTIIQNSK